MNYFFEFKLSFISVNLVDHQYLLKDLSDILHGIFLYAECSVVRLAEGMNLRIKSLIVIATGFILIILLFASYASFYLDSHYKTLENEQVTKTSQSRYQQIVTDLQTMDRLLRGYSGWNDSYQYVQNPEDSYLSTNYQSEFLRSNGLDGIIILNRTGYPLFTQKRTPDSDILTTFSSVEIIPVKDLGERYNLLSRTSGIVGIVSLVDHDALIASEPILTDSYEGPAQGTMHFLIWLDSRYMGRLTSTLDHQIYYSKIPAPGIREDADHDLDSTHVLQKPDPTVTTSLVNESVILGRFEIPDLSGMNKYQFNIPLPRDLYVSGKQLIFTTILLLILSGLGIGVTVLIFMDRVLLSRIDLIIHKIHEARIPLHPEQNDEDEIEIDPGDELDLLDRAIDPIFFRISETKHELQKNVNFFKVVTDSIRDGLCIFEGDGSEQKQIYCNPRSHEILGNICHHATITDLLSLAILKDRDRVMKEWNTIINSPRHDGLISSWICTSSGDHKYVIFRFASIEYESESPRILVICSDITERKMAEESLQESEAKYRFMTENVSDVHWQLTPDLTFTYISPADEIMRGFRSDEVVGRRIWDFIPAHAREHFKEIVAERYSHFKAGERLPAGLFQTEWMKKDGGIIWIEIVSNPIYQYDGKLTGFHGTFRDITERKLYEAAINQANKKLNLLSSITRHDLLNQMTVILSTLELMKEEDITPEIRSFLDTEDVAAEKVIRLIRFSHDYQDIGLSAPQWLSVSSLVHQAMATLNPSGIELVINTDSLFVFADVLLEKVFLNLIDNSMRHGGHVTMITIDGYIESDGFHLIYADDGSGVSFDEKERIFSRGVGKNTGMGLFLIREILSITSIIITENGMPGKGARFEMIIPVGRYRIGRDE